MLLKGNFSRNSVLARSWFPYNLPYRILCAYLVRRSCMFCLTCGLFLVGTAFFIPCGSIFVYTYGGLIRIRFIRTYMYNLALVQEAHE